MNYPENTVDWPVGSIVIHDGDAKTPEMLMRVIDVKVIEAYNGPISYTDEYKMYILEYLSYSKIEKIGRNYSKRKLYKCLKKYLHNPKDFGINVEDIKVNQIKLR